MKLSIKIFLLGFFSGIFPAGIIFFFLFFDRWGLLQVAYRLPVVNLLPNQQAVLFFLVFLAFFIVLIVDIIFSQRATKPLRNILEAAISLVEGEFDSSILENKKDEEGVIGQCLQQVAEKIIKAEQEFSELNETFEKEGKTKIKELESQTSRLESRAEERNIELQKRINELERFRKLSVGRELKMLELKRELEGFKNGSKNNKALQ